MSHPATATPTATATATPAPLPPAPTGVYALTPSALDVLSLADGTLQRRLPSTNPGANSMAANASPPVIAGGAVYFVVGGLPSGAADVLALRTTDASELWRFPMPSTSRAPGLSVVDGTVFVAAYAVGFPGTFYALSARDGRELWHAQAATIRPPATVADGVVYLAVQPNDGKQHLLALRATDGTQLWDFAVPTCGVFTPPAVDNGMVYLTCESPTDSAPADAYGVRASDGKLIWHDGSLGLSVTAPAAGDALVYLDAGGCGAFPHPSCPPLYFYGCVRTQNQRW